MSGWPVPLRGVTETVTTTQGPDGHWNAAALGIHAGNPATCRTWGRTRTWQNFEREGEGYVCFLDDPMLFVEAALDITEFDHPIPSNVAAWARVQVDTRVSGTTNGTKWMEWTLTPVASTVVRRTIPTLRRATAAVVEASIAASRLDVKAYDESELRRRLDWCEKTVNRTGDSTDQAALARVRELSDW